MTLWCFLSCGFTAVLPELDDDLNGVFLLGLYVVHALDLLQSLEWVKEHLCKDDLWCGVSQHKQWVLWQWCEVLLWGIHYVCYVTWNDLYGSCGDYDSYNSVVEIVTLICCAYICPMVASRSWSGAMLLKVAERWQVWHVSCTNDYCWTTSQSPRVSVCWDCSIMLYSWCGEAHLT